MGLAIPGLLLGQIPALGTEGVDLARPKLAHTTQQMLCPAQLGPEVDRVLSRAALARTRWGILVQTQSPDRQTLYAREAQKYFIPASNVKLLTAAAALIRLGPQFRIRTVVNQIPSDRGQVIVQIVGRGDPTLGQSQLQWLAQRLQQRGIRRIDQLVADDRYFADAVIPATWEWEDVQTGYGAPVNSLILNQNALDLQLKPQAIGQPLQVIWADPAMATGWQIENRSVTVVTDAPEFVDVGRDWSRPILRVQGQLRVGSEPEPVAISVVDPTLHFLQQFRRVLATQQITVGQLVRDPIALNSRPVELAALDSPPLSELLKTVNLESNNLYAEVLLRLLGGAPSATTITLSQGIATTRNVLATIGVNPDSYRLADGSGLSRHNLVSPAALVQVLQGMRTSTYAPIYRNALPVAGMSGTLQYRFRQTAAQGIVRAKTGTLTGVSALSGYLEPPNAPPLVFSILANQSDRSTAELQQAIDEIVLVLTRLKTC